MFFPYTIDCIFFGYLWDRFFYSTNYNFIRYTWFNRSVRIANVSPSESSNKADTAYMVLYLKMRGISIHTESEIGKHRVAVTWQLNACQCWKMFLLSFTWKLYINTILMNENVLSEIIHHRPHIHLSMSN